MWFIISDLCECIYFMIFIFPYDDDIPSQRRNEVENAENFPQLKSICFRSFPAIGNSKRPTWANNSELKYFNYVCVFVFTRKMPENVLVREKGKARILNKKNGINSLLYR